MAKKRTRRSVSLSRATYDAIMESSRAAGISASEWLTQLIRVQCPTLTQQIHVRPASAEQPSHAVVPKRLDLITGDSFDRGEVASVPIAPRSVINRMTTEQVRAVLVPATSGTLCANCVDAPATTRGRVDVAGPEYPLCRDCVLPNDRVEDGRGRWKRKPGTIRENQIADELGEP